MVATLSSDIALWCGIESDLGEVDSTEGSYMMISELLDSYSLLQENSLGGQRRPAREKAVRTPR